jgi:ABC-type bacteriocin/lantibiotic exporter with double-glycine peptidase domain
MNNELEKVLEKIKPVKIPYYKQETGYTCGAACMRMILESMGIKKSEKQVANLLKTNKMIGTWHKNIAELAEKYKFDYTIFRGATWLDLLFYKETGWRIIVCFTNRENFFHYCVVKKINWHSIYLLDPSAGPKERYFIPDFKKRWYDHEGKRWFMAIKTNSETIKSKKND